MITKTVGTTPGTDFQTWLTAWNYIRGLGPLANDYDFVQVHDIDMNSGEFFNNLNNHNGHIVYFRCPFINSHKGVFNNGFKTNISGTMKSMIVRWVGAGTFIFDGLNIDLNVITYSAISGGSGSTGLLVAKNILIDGNNKINNEGISVAVYSYPCELYNIKITRCGGLGIGGASGTSNYPLPATINKKIENVTIYNCGNNADASLRYGILLGYDSNLRSYLRNVVVCHDTGYTTDYNILRDGISGHTYNCAETHNTLTDAIYDHNAVHNVVAADEFESLDVTDDDFLFLKDGSILASFSRNPTGNLLVKERCKFTPGVIFTPGGTIGELGMAPTLSTQDITGKSRPGGTGLYAIGAHEQQYF